MTKAPSSNPTKIKYNMSPKIPKIADIQADAGYIFANPGRARIRVRTEDEDPYVDTSGSTWRWTDSGTSLSVTWDKISLPDSLKEIAKAYIFHRLESRSPRTVLKDVSIFREISVRGFSLDFPWTKNSDLKILAALDKSKASESGIAFRVFYCWCLTSDKPGFFKDIYFISSVPTFSHQEFVS